MQRYESTRYSGVSLERTQAIMEPRSCYAQAYLRFIRERAGRQHMSKRFETTVFVRSLGILPIVGSVAIHLCRSWVFTVAGAVTWYAMGTEYAFFGRTHRLIAGSDSSRLALEHYTQQETCA